MPEQKQPLELTAQQLLEEYSDLERVPQEKLTPEEQERFERLGVELKRRENDEDPELCELYAIYASAIEGMKRDAEQLPVPPLAADFAPSKLSSLATSSLEALLREKESHLELWKKAYGATSNWLEARLSDRGEQALEEICRNIRREVTKRHSEVPKESDFIPPRLADNKQSETAAPPGSDKQTKRGRPRDDKSREVIRKLRALGWKWPKIRDEVNRSLNQNKTAEDYRKLWGSENTGSQEPGRN